MGIEEIEHSAGGVVFKESKTGPLYLILISKRRIWEFPKGHLEPGEDTKMAALREVKEETGLSELELFDGFSFKIIYEFFKNGNKVKKMLFII
jgi:ADP-ribose pyrophosphatase